MVEFEIFLNERRTPPEERLKAVTAPAFGTTFTDHMVTLRWDAGRGWHSARLGPYENLHLPPATAVFHYGQAVFEGMKAYRQSDGSVALFRPRDNARRFNSSARRLAMPELDPDLFVESLERLVTADRGWVPDGEGMSLYLRPFMIATQPTLNFSHPSTSYLFCVMASPAGPYFGAGGLRALSVWLCEDFVRAAPGGTGAAKVAGNYAGALAASREASEHDCDQVVWLDSGERRWVEEMGGMNLFFVRDGSPPRLTTPPLTGTLLPGLTRDSLLTACSSLGLQPSEERVSAEQWRAECASGLMTEAFACGTAAVIAPVGRVRSGRGDWLVGDGRPGPMTTRLRDRLLSLQHGRAPDPFGWVHKVC